MKITKDEVKYVANLARLNLTEAEAERLQTEMADIIAFADTLSNLDTEGIEPTNHAIRVENVLREDENRPSYDRDALLNCAPAKQAGCYSVPKVVE
ncbi:MAG: Asp-tRNA(Asn)/Glu-tRNA(Gln) amidotransferase subunit GatC [Clostridia bacterium]|nr:Asp-tRNA(Asn)/Glu-tRNA(Gln) amidotransferase subunit GatC [Clostridia bacterium]